MGENLPRPRGSLRRALGLSDTPGLLAGTIIGPGAFLLRPAAA